MNIRWFAGALVCFGTIVVNGQTPHSSTDQSRSRHAAAEYHVSAAPAPLEHADCKISAVAQLKITGDATRSFDWSEKPELVRIFSDAGYTAEASADWNKLAEGKLFTDLTLFCQGYRSGGAIRYKCAAALKVYRRSAGKPGYEEISAGSGEEFRAATLPEAIRAATEGVIPKAPKCVKKPT